MFEILIVLFIIGYSSYKYGSYTERNKIIALENEQVVEKIIKKIIEKAGGLNKFIENYIEKRRTEILNCDFFSHLNEKEKLLLIHQCRKDDINHVIDRLKTNEQERLKWISENGFSENKDESIKEESIEK